MRSLVPLLTNRTASSSPRRLIAAPTRLAARGSPITTSSAGRSARTSAPAPALVVVDDVEIVPALGQDLPRPQAECERLGKPGRAHQGELEDVDSTAHLAGTGDAKGVGLAVQVEAGDLHEGHAVVEVGV